MARRRLFKNPWAWGPSLASFGGAGFGSSVMTLFDANIPSSMTFSGARTIDGTGTQYFSYTTAASIDPLYFKGSGTSKWMYQGWHRIDALAGGSYFPSGSGDADFPLIGVYSSNFSVISWLLRLRYVHPTTYSLIVTMGTNAGGTTTGQAVWNHAFDPSYVFNSQVDPLLNLWFHLAAFYDGSQSTDAAKMTVYVNGAQITGVGFAPSTSALPTQMGFPSSGTAKLYVANPGIAGVSLPMSWRDLALCASLPATISTAASDLWNGGHGVTDATWPASCPSLAYYYRGNANMSSTTPTVPSGDEQNVANPGTGDLTASAGSPGGELEVQAWADRSGGRTAVFGWTPTQTSGQRMFEGIYTTLNSKPRVKFHKRSPASQYLQAYAALSWPNAHQSLGSAGAILGNFSLTSQIFGYNQVLTFCDRSGSSTSRILALALETSQPAFSYQGSGTDVAISGISIGASAVITTSASHGLSANDPFYFDLSGLSAIPVDSGTGAALVDSSGGFLPATGIYYVKAVSDSTHFTFSNSQTNYIAGSAVTTSGSFTGTAKIKPCKFVAGQGVCAVTMEMASSDTNSSGSNYSYSLASGGIPFGRQTTVNGVETSGVQLSTNYYPTIGNTAIVAEVGNIGNGQTAASRVFQTAGAAPYYIYAGDGSSPLVSQSVWMDDGGGGGHGNSWGGSYPNLDTLVINGSFNVASSTIAAQATGAEIYVGALAVIRRITQGADSSLRDWIRTR